MAVLDDIEKIMNPLDPSLTGLIGAAPLIVLLRKPSRPSQVSGFIVTVNVNSIESQFRRRFRPYC